MVICCSLPEVWRYDNAIFPTIHYVTYPQHIIIERAPVLDKVRLYPLRILAVVHAIHLHYHLTYGDFPFNMSQHL